MKRKQIILTLIVIVFTIGIILTVQYKNNLKDKDKIKDTSTDSWEYNADKIYIKEMNDGWYYYFQILTSNKERKNLTYYYDGCNIRYSRIDGYEERTKTADGSDYITYPLYPSLSDKYRKDTDSIYSYFKEKQFNKEITNKDLNDLELKYFKKSDIVTFYNNANKLEWSTGIPIETNLTTCNLNTKKINNYEVLVGTIFAWTGFKVVRLDIKYSDGTYLRDLVKENKATKEQIEIYNNFTKMEEYIVENNKLDLEENFGYTGDIYNAIYEITQGFLVL